MLAIEIPDFKKIEAEHLVLDFNGTLAIDGKLIDGVKPLLEKLSQFLTIHVLTADTFGTSKEELSDMKCKLVILEPDLQDVQKEEYIVELGESRVIAIGNGKNDFLMLEKAVLSITVIQEEGSYAKLLTVSDLVCRNIFDALNLILNPKRLVATLRK